MGKKGEKLHPSDLKIQVIETYQNEGLSYQKIAEKYSIGKTTAHSIIQKVAKYSIYKNADFTWFKGIYLL